MTVKIRRTRVRRRRYRRESRRRWRSKGRDKVI